MKTERTGATGGENAPVIPQPAEQPGCSPRERAIRWMNRGHALSLAGDAAAALTAYDEAIALLLPYADSRPASWRNSLAACYLNRGWLLHRNRGTLASSAALDCYARAECLLRELLATHAAGGGEPGHWPRRNLAGTLLNRANLLLDLGRCDEALGDATDALRFARIGESESRVDADLSLKCHRAVCDAIGQIIVQPGTDQHALAGQASDAVDDALTLARLWYKRGGDGFRPLAARLFRFGAELFRLHQPQFLAEFISEHLEVDCSGEFRSIALKSIDAALAAPPSPLYLVAGDPAAERRIQTEHDLIACWSRITGARYSRGTKSLG